MLGTDARTLRVAWTVFLFALVAVLVYLVRNTLAVFTLAVFLAHLLGPVVDRVQRVFPRTIPRTLALALVFLVLVGAALAVLIAVGAKIGEQAAALASRIPEILKQDPISHLPLPSSLEEMRPRLTELVRAQVDNLDKTVLSVLKDIGTGILSGIGNLLPVILIPVLSFLFLKDGPLLRDALVGCVPYGKQELAEEILADLHVLVAQYIRALVLLAIVAFVITSIFLSSIGVPYAILLAGIAGMMEFIPVVGPITSIAVILLVAILSGYPHLVWIVVFLILFRMFQDYLVSPQLMSRGVAIHPLLVLFGVLAGQQVAGIAGMFFSVPVMAALRIILVRMRKPAVHA